MKLFSSRKQNFHVEDIALQLNAEISKAHQAIIKTSVMPEAQALASKNWPKADEQSAEHYFTSFRGQYKTLGKDVSVRLKGSLQKFLGTVGVTPLNIKVQESADEIKKERDEMKNREADVAHLETMCGHHGYEKYYWILFLFALAECFFCIVCLIYLSDILIVAIVVGTIIGLAQVWAAKIMTLKIREAANPRKQRRDIIFTIIGVTLVSLTLGSLRYYFAHRGLAFDIPILVLNPFTFASINMLLIVASALVVYLFFPTKQEMINQSEATKIKKEITKRKCGLQKLLKQHDKIVHEQVNAIKMHGEIAHCEKELIEKIEGLYEEAVGAFKHCNITRRNDGVYPQCFKQPHKPLSTRTDNGFNFLTDK